MPPKKKGMTSAAKTSKQGPLEQIKPEPEILQSEPKEIPKRPHYRYMNYDSSLKVRHLRVKLWKIHSCALSSFYFEPCTKYQQAHERLQKTFKISTIRKSLKNVKRMKYDPSFFSKHQVFRQLCSTWRIESLSLSPGGKRENYDVLRAFLKQSLKFCLVSAPWRSIGEIIDPKLVAAFRIVRTCKLTIHSFQDREFVRINPARLPYHKLKMLWPLEDDGNHAIGNEEIFRFNAEKEAQKKEDGVQLMNSILINASKCFEEIKFSWIDAPKKEQRAKIELPVLPNLEKLDFTWSKREQDEKAGDISWIKQYSKLKSLGISFHHHETETLDFLVDLPKLKEFSFSSSQSSIRKGPMRSLPDLTQLEKFTLHLNDTPIFTMKHVQDFISKNKDLRELHLSLPIQTMGILFEVELPKIQRLTLNLIKLETPYIGAAKAIAEMLKTHDCIKELALKIAQSYADLNAILLKDGVAKMKSLEKLTLEWGMSGGLEGQKFKHLKDVFTNQAGLVALDLDISRDRIGSREIGPILDGLIQLKNLKKLRLKANLAKTTPAVSNKLSTFIISHRRLKELEVNSREIFDGEDEKQLREEMLPRFPLSKRPFESF